MIDVVVVVVAVMAAAAAGSTTPSCLFCLCRSTQTRCQKTESDARRKVDALICCGHYHLLHDETTSGWSGSWVTQGAITWPPSDF